MGRAGLINFNSKGIYYMDFSGLKLVNEIMDLINDSKRFISTQLSDSLLTLTNISQMHFSNEIRDLFTAFIKGNKPYVKAGAVIGISGLQSIVYNAIMKVNGRNLKSMNSIEEAKTCLVSQG